MFPLSVLVAETYDVSFPPTDFSRDTLTVCTGSTVKPFRMVNLKYGSKEIIQQLSPRSGRPPNYDFTDGYVLFVQTSFVTDVGKDGTTGLPGLVTGVTTGLLFLFVY